MEERLITIAVVVNVCWFKNIYIVVSSCIWSYGSDQFEHNKLQEKTFAANWQSLIKMYNYVHVEQYDNAREILNGVLKAG